MTARAAAFAIPGDIATLTGGYIYERRLLWGLRALGHDIEHVVLSATFPDPTAAVTAETSRRLAALDRPLILDGLVFGALEGLEAVAVPVVAMVHHPLALETGLSDARRAHLHRTERRNLAIAHHVLVPSPHTKRILETQYDVPPSKITIALPGTEQATAERVPSDPPLILSVGLQHPRKGHDILLRALADLTDLPWRAVIVGRAHDPAHAATLAAMVTDLGLSDRVTLAGTVPRAELDALYRAATLFALATRYEGYGMVFDEALSWGLPIVTCATGAVPDTVPFAAGLLVEPDQPAPLASALRRLLTDAALRAACAKSAAQAGAARPTWEDTARIASRVLRDLP